MFHRLSALTDDRWEHDEEVVFKLQISAAPAGRRVLAAVESEQLHVDDPQPLMNEPQCRNNALRKGTASEHAL